jgi:multidrug efflux pump subunit AcrA (membrane-fusion protein)
MIPELTAKTTIVHRAHWIILGGAVIIILLFTWAALAKIEEITRLQGLVIAKSRTQIIQAAIDGVIAEVDVHEGQKVQKDQIIARLERTQAEAAQKDSLGKVAALEAALVRLHAEVLGSRLEFPESVQAYPQFIANQTELYNRRQQALKSEISALENSLRLIKEELNLSMPLAQAGDIGKIEIIRLQRQVSDLSGQISLRRNKYFQDAQAEMTKAEEDLSTQQQLLTERTTIVERLDIRATSDGLVKKIHLTTPGAKVRPGEVIMELLPTDSSLIVEGKLQPADIAFIRPGMPASVKLDAYDYSIYGVFSGEVVYISPDAIAEETRQGEMLYYRVHVRLDEMQQTRNGKPIEVQPGMTAGIDIHTGEKTVLHYLVKPIAKVFHESMNER